MSNNDNKKQDKSNSTTDFFLSFVKENQDKKTSSALKKENIEDRKNKTVNIFFTTFNYINLILDKMLNNKHSLRIISFILALVLFFTFSGGDVFNSTTSGTTIKNVAVKVEGLQSGLEVSGVPSKVTIGLIGPSIDIYSTQLKRNYEVYVDLKNYSTGNYNVSIKTRNFDKDLTVMVLPESCNIKIAPEVTKTFDVQSKYINEDQLDEKFVVSTQSISKTKVTVSGSQSNIDKIENVYALIDVSNKTSAFKQTCELKAYDSSNNVVKCNISPSKVNVSCLVDSYSKTVAVKPAFQGNVAEGFKLSSYKLSPNSIVIYGKKSDLINLSTVSCNVNIDGLSGSTKLTGLTIEQNDKISKMSVNTIEIELTIDKN